MVFYESSYFIYKHWGWSCIGWKIYLWCSKKFNVDTVEIDTLAFAGKSTSKKVENIYVKTVKKSPKFFGLLYRAGEKISNPKIKSIIYILNTLYSKNIYNIIKKKNRI